VAHTDEAQKDRKLSILLKMRGHYATRRKVAGSIPDEVTGFFN
jgi:hypothetical protein